MFCRHLIEWILAFTVTRELKYTVALMTPVATRILIPTDCHQEKKTTDFTTKNFERGLMGCSSSWQAVYIKTKQYNAQHCSKTGVGHSMVAFYLPDVPFLSLITSWKNLQARQDMIFKQDLVSRLHKRMHGEAGCT